MIDHAIRHRYLACVLLSLTLLWAGCVTTTDRYRRAQELTAEGQYVEAARSYVEVLEADADWTEARDELRAVGQRAIDNLQVEAETLEADGRYEQAVDALRTLDDLREEVAAVDVELTVPDDYAAYRADLFRTTADALVEEGTRAEEVGDWPAAADAYERAREYVQSDERATLLREAQAQVLLQWSEDALAQNHYRTAYERADRISGILAETHPLREDVAALQSTAVERGTRAVAFLPLWRTNRAAENMSRYFLRDFNDVLQLDQWAAAPRFIAPVDPIAARRTLRRMGADRTVLPRSVAAKVGQELGADLVLTGALVRYERVADNIRERERETRIRVRGATGQGPQWRDTTYVVQTFDLELEAEVEYRLIEARTGQSVSRGSVWDRASDEMQRGRFPGDYRQLDLSGSEVSLFNESDLRLSEREVEDRLMDRLGETLANEVFSRVLHRID